VIPVAALRDSLGNGILDLCDHARGFKIGSARAQGSSFIFDYAAFPGRTYQVQWADGTGGGWTNWPATNYAMPPQTLLNFTDTPASGSSQRFYRVQLLP
jgi:hypothetical protein